MLIFHVLNFLKKELNSAFKNSQTWSEDKVVVSNLNTKGVATNESNNGLVLTLVKITQEAVMKNYNPGTYSGGNYTKKAQPLTFYVDFMLSANNSLYEESLKLLSHAILFFQSNSSFDHTNSELFEGVSRLSLSIVDLSYHELSNIWSMLGGAQAPSVLYRCRLITFDANQVNEIVSSISSGGLSND